MRRRIASGSDTDHVRVRPGADSDARSARLNPHGPEAFRASPARRPGVHFQSVHRCSANRGQTLSSTRLGRRRCLKTSRCRLQGPRVRHIGQSRYLDAPQAIAPLVDETPQQPAGFRRAVSTERRVSHSRTTHPVGSMADRKRQRRSESSLLPPPSTPRRHATSVPVSGGTPPGARAAVRAQRVS